VLGKEVVDCPVGLPFHIPRIPSNPIEKAGIRHVALLQPVAVQGGHQMVLIISMVMPYPGAGCQRGALRQGKRSGTADTAAAHLAGQSGRRLRDALCQRPVGRSKGEELHDGACKLVPVPRLGALPLPCTKFALVLPADRAPCSAGFCFGDGLGRGV